MHRRYSVALAVEKVWNSSRQAFLCGSFFFVFFLISVSASAETLRSKATQALDAEDYAQLEALFSEAAAKARKDGDQEPLFDAYKQFGKAHNGRFINIKSWQKAYPESPYAAAALSKMHSERAGLLRGSYSLRYTPREAHEAFREELRNADKYAQIALKAAPDFVPAIREALSLASLGFSGDRHALASHLMDVAPERNSIIAAIGAFHPARGGSQSAGMKFCKAAAKKVADYDEELCLIQVTFNYRVRGSVRAAAMKALEGRDEPFLDYWRLKLYMNEWRYRPEAVEEIKRIHKASLHWLGFDGTDFMNTNRTLVALFDLALFAAEMDEAAMEEMEQRLQDEPQNHVLARGYIFHKLRRDRNLWGNVPKKIMQELTAMWPDMMDLGLYSSETWKIGWKLMGNHAGFHRLDLLEPFTTNRIYYSNHSPNDIQSHMQDVYHLWNLSTSDNPRPLSNPQAREVQGSSKCAVVRASRLFEEICKSESDLMGCNIGGMGQHVPEQSRRLSRKDTQCSETHAELKDLIYGPVAVPLDIFETTPPKK